MQDVTAAEADKVVKIIDNGGVPFIVRISYQRKVATILKSPAFGLPPTDASEVLLTLAFERAFVGLDLPERKDPPPAPLWVHGGNSVLLDEGGGRHVYIGSEGFRFAVEPGDSIVDYVSPIGNSCVPYPFAVGEVNTYFMVEPCYLPNSIMDKYPPEKRENAYDVLYDNDLDKWLPGAEEEAGGSGERRPGAGLHVVGRMWKLRDRELVIQRSL